MIPLVVSTDKEYYNLLIDALIKLPSLTYYSCNPYTEMLVTPRTITHYSHAIGTIYIINFYYVGIIVVTCFPS